MENVPFYVHDLGKLELESIKSVLQGRILTTGDTVEKFESIFSDYLDCKHILAVNSCTGAMHLSLIAMNIGPGDEVITTPLTFIATATSILESGAKPVFVDVEDETGNINVELIETSITKNAKGIIPVHLYGHMCDMKSLSTIGDKHNLRIIEDCAHCIEGERDGVKPAQLGDTACFSFFATKNITCGEGGAIAVNSQRLYERLRLLSLHGMTKTSNDRFREGYKHWNMTDFGWKYNLSNIQAALLIPQMERIDNNNFLRQQLATAYTEQIAAIEGITIFSNQTLTKHARHLFPVRINNKPRDEVVKKLIENGIEVVVNYRAIHLLDYFKNNYGYKNGDFPVAEKIGNEVISLPFYPNMPSDHVNIVCDTLKKIMSH